VFSHKTLELHPSGHGEKKPQRGCLEFSAAFSGVLKGLYAPNLSSFIYYSVMNSKGNDCFEVTPRLWEE